MIFFSFCPTVHNKLTWSISRLPPMSSALWLLLHYLGSYWPLANGTPTWMQRILTYFTVYSFPFLNSFFFLKHNVQIWLIKEDLFREELIKKFYTILFGIPIWQEIWGAWQPANLVAEHSLQGSATQNYYSETGYGFCLTSSWKLSNYFAVKKEKKTFPSLLGVKKSITKMTYPQSSQ